MTAEPETTKAAIERGRAKDAAEDMRLSANALYRRSDNASVRILADGLIRQADQLDSPARQDR